MNRMKKSYQNLLVIVSVFVFVFLNTTMIQAAEGFPMKNTIQVSGKATIKVKPNIAYISATVETENKDAKLAQQENAKLISQIQKDIKSKYKIQDADINTSYYGVRPSYDYVEGKQIFRGYVVEHTLAITAQDITKVGEMVDTLVASGATSIGSIRFDVLDSDATYNLALQKAIGNATSKANAITTTLGVKAGKPIAIVEQSGSVGIIEREMNQLKQEAAVAFDATSIGQSEIEVTANVLATFQY